MLLCLFFKKFELKTNGFLYVLARRIWLKNNQLRSHLLQSFHKFLQDKMLISLPQILVACLRLIFKFGLWRFAYKRIGFFQIETVECMNSVLDRFCAEMVWLSIGPIEIFDIFLESSACLIVLWQNFRFVQIIPRFKNP